MVFQPTETPANITKAFNEYFANIGPNLAKKKL